MQRVFFNAGRVRLSETVEGLRFVWSKGNLLLLVAGIRPIHVHGEYLWVWCEDLAIGAVPKTHKIIGWCDIGERHLQHFVLQRGRIGWFADFLRGDHYGSWNNRGWPVRLS